jgi:hypothetical protein
VLSFCQPNCAQLALEKKKQSGEKKNKENHPPKIFFDFLRFYHLPNPPIPGAVS